MPGPIPIPIGGKATAPGIIGRFGGVDAVGAGVGVGVGVDDVGT